MSKHLDQLRSDLASALADEIGMPLVAVEAAVATVTADWKVTRKDYPNSNDHPLADVRYGHKLVVTLPFVPETDGERAERELRTEAFFWCPEKGAPPERVRILQLLRQDEWWRANATHDRGDGVSSTVAVRVEDMTHDHRLALLEWLRARARRFHAAAFTELGNAPDDVWSSHERHEPSEWLEEHELVQALVRWTTPYGEAPLTWRPATEHPDDGINVMARRTGFGPDEPLVKVYWSGEPLVKVYWSGYHHRWCAVGVPAGVIEAGDLAEWRELRDDEKPAPPPPPCDHEGYEESDCGTCGAPWYPCRHGGVRGSTECEACWYGN
jgi:hypothetical protein